MQAQQPTLAEVAHPVVRLLKKVGTSLVAGLCALAAPAHPTLSLIGVENNRVVPHYKIKQHMLKSGLEYTFLRPSFFMQNLSTTHREEIKDQSEIFVTAGRDKTSFI